MLNYENKYLRSVKEFIVKLQIQFEIVKYIQLNAYIFTVIVKQQVINYKIISIYDRLRVYCKNCMFVNNLVHRILKLTTYVISTIIISCYIEKEDNYKSTAKSLLYIQFNE